ncbi:MAG: transglutaminase-like domain-containing protein, partial [Oscillospiraceae bacterium]
GGITIDYSNTKDGYLMAKCSEKYPRVKIQIIKEKETYTYDLDCNDKYVVFPLQMGDGEYTVRAMKNVGETKYAMITSGKVSVKLENALSPYLIPNQIVNYTKDSETVKKSNELTVKKDTDLKKIESIYEYIIKNITYDDEKAKEVVSKVYFPVVDNILKTKKGICYDYSAVLATMLRSQGIPTKLVTGYVSPTGTYHAWNEIYITGVGWVDSEIYFDGVNWQRVDSTFASTDKNSKAINKYIQDNANYQKKYQY